MLTEPKLQEILDRLPTLKIALVGDLFLDKYLDLDARLTEVSVETGLEAYQVVRVRCYPGAGGTVLNNLHALGVGNLRAVSVIGSDGEGFELLRGLKAKGVETAGVIAADSRMTPTYTKPMLAHGAGPASELNRLDIKNRTEPPPELDRQVIEQLDRIAGEVDALIVADQVTERNRGVITDDVRAHLAVLAERYPRLVVFADSRAHFALFRGCITKPNRSELFHAVGESAVESANRSTVVRAARQLASWTGRPVFATMGAEGMLYIESEECHDIPGIPVDGPIDIVGAGDSATAGIVSALCAGASPVGAAELGCLVASITIQQIGVTGTASPQQVLERLRNRSGHSGAGSYDSSFVNRP